MYIIFWVIKLHSKNKKAIANPVMWIVVAVAVLLVIFILFSRGAFGLGKITSLTPKSSGYNEDNCKDIGVVVSGNVNIEDSAIFDLEPSIKEVTVDEVLVNSKKLAIGVEQFTYEVEASDEITGQKLGRTFTGSGELRSRDNKGISKPYSVSFTIPDNNCDRQIDDFNLKITATLKGKDIGDRATYEKLIRFRQGRIAK